ncbi:DUF6471 domain-containing protein [Burkholderia thailandensis]|uniref:DUF6471 domain-containing protein n=1 Tax=Burkholderia thailandensis TaxID=57975 RepID=UPI00107ECC0B|nr:DUF6471 domain-containing protein [Burkholderia thailandensis]TGB33045.1 hypothetical protein C6946_14360 [Burkholderia thailandensis]
METLPHKPGRLPAQPYGAWEEEAKGLIEEEMMRRGIRYKQLSRMLEKLGIEESPDQLNRKVNRKRFSAAFLIACLRAMGVENIALQLKQGQTDERQPSGNRPR